MAVVNGMAAKPPYAFACAPCPADAICPEGVKAGDLFQPQANEGCVALRVCVLVNTRVLVSSSHCLSVPCCCLCSAGGRVQ